MMLTSEEIQEFLPNLDCRQCGLTCVEFADLLLKQELAPEDCPVLHEPDYAGFIEALHELLGQPEVPGGRRDADRSGQVHRLWHLRRHVRVSPGQLCRRPTG